MGVAFEFKLPDVGEGITEGEIVRWLVAAGDTVALDQPLLELQTDKAVVELPAPRAGVILERRGEPGQVIPVGTTLVVIGTADDAVPAEAPAPADPEGRAPAPPEAAAAPRPAQALPAPGRVQAAPATRRLARELGIDLAQVAGSGPRGRVLPDDVRGYQAQAAEASARPAAVPVPEEKTAIALVGLRRVIAEHMTTSVREIPHVTVVERFDATELVRVRTALRRRAEEMSVRLTYLPLVAKALMLALAEYPMFNARWENGTCYQYHQVHLGMATDTPDGLVVPVIRDAQSLSVLDLARAMARLAAAAPARTLGTGELAGSTVTITGGGPLAGLFATPIINYPEVGILGVYRIREEAQVVAQQVKACPMLYVSWTFDHRIADGAVASRFLRRLGTLLEDPDSWLLLLH